MPPADISSSSFGSLIARPRRPREIEVARIDCAQPTHKYAIWQPELLDRDCGAWSILRRFDWDFEGFGPLGSAPDARGATIELPDFFKML